MPSVPKPTMPLSSKTKTATRSTTRSWTSNGNSARDAICPHGLGRQCPKRFALQGRRGHRPACPGIHVLRGQARSDAPAHRRILELLPMLPKTNLKLIVNPNGTLTIIDKLNGNQFNDLLTFEDRSEIGDGWFHGHTMSDEIALSTGAQAQISVVEDGPCPSPSVQVSMNLPKRYNWHTEHRSTAADLLIVSLATLRKNATQVESRPRFTTPSRPIASGVLFLRRQECNHMVCPPSLRLRGT